MNTNERIAQISAQLDKLLEKEFTCKFCDGDFTASEVIGEYGYDFDECVLYKTCPECWDLLD